MSRPGIWEQFAEDAVKRLPRTPRRVMTREAIYQGLREQRGARLAQFEAQGRELRDASHRIGRTLDDAMTWALTFSHRNLAGYKRDDSEVTKRGYEIVWFSAFGLPEGYGTPFGDEDLQARLVEGKEPLPTLKAICQIGRASCRERCRSRWWAEDVKRK